MIDDEDEIAAKRRARAEKKAQAQSSKSITSTDQSKSETPSYLPREMKSVRPNLIDFDSTTTRAIKIMTWNILAQCLVRRSLFPGSDCLKWKDRGPAITREIVDYNPDVVCLQEVDRLSDHGPILSRAGYAYTHVIGGYEQDGKQHGLLIGWKQDVFCLVQQQLIRLDEQHFKSRQGLSRVTRNVALVGGLAFKHHTGGLIIGTAHLFWHARYSYERARQTAFLSQALAQFRVPSHDTTTWPIFLAGDLNEQPGGPAYRLLSGTSLPQRERSIFQESSLIHRSTDELVQRTGETYTTFEGDEDRVFKDVRPARESDGLFDFQELQEISGFRTWSSLYGNWGGQMSGEENNRFEDRPEFDRQLKAQSSLVEDRLRSGQHEPMWTNFTPLWRCTLDYIWVLNHPSTHQNHLQVLALLPTHRSEALEPGLPRIGVEPSDHISLMAEVLIPYRDET